MKSTRFCILNYTSLSYRIKILFIVFVLFFNLSRFANSTTVTLGIDWGEEYVEASIAFRGHRPDILLTGTGSRKFENAVYLLGDTRLFDKEASSFALKDPSKTLQKSAHLLGIPFASSSKWTRMSTVKASDVVETLKRNNVSFHWDYTPYEFGVSKDGQLHLKVLKDSMVGLEEATAHFFNHLKNVALDKLVSVKAIESHDSKVEMMAVISIPCNYTQNQRRALVFAAESAGLKVVDLVHGITAAAWLNTLEMAPGTKKILYYDLGSSGANVGVVEARVPPPKSKDHPQIRTLSCVTYPGIGGRQHDLLLAEYLRDKFESDNNVKLMPGNPRSLQKLLKSVNKAKMKLSLSETASVEVDNLVKNKHLNVKLTRSDYDKLLDPVLQKLSEPLNMALREANLKLSDLDSVEMLGGAWRVPSVTTKLSESVKPLHLGFHLNAEESIAMGCGYLAAAHNPFFRMKKIELYDNAVFEYVLHVRGPDLDKRVTLYKSGDRINHSKVVKVNTSSSFNLSIYERYTASDSLAEVKVLDYKVTGVEDTLLSQKKHRVAQVSLTFKTENGVIRLVKVSGKPVRKHGDKKLSKTTEAPTEVSDVEHASSEESTNEDEGLEAGASAHSTTTGTTTTSSTGAGDKHGVHEEKHEEKQKQQETSGGKTSSKFSEDKDAGASKASDAKDAGAAADSAAKSGSGDATKSAAKETEDKDVTTKSGAGGDKEADKAGDKEHERKKSDHKKETAKEKGEKQTKESLKEKLMHKLNEEQVDLKFVDNTMDLYHDNKLKETMKNIETLVIRDKLALERSHLKNKLESMLYKYKAVLRSQDFKAACRPNEEQALSEKVKSLLDWFEEHSYKATLETFKKHLEELNELGAPIYRRMDSNVNRESLVKSTDAEFADLQEKLAQLLAEKPYLSDSASTLEMFRNSVAWWEQVKQDQAKRPLFEEGLFDHASVKSKVDLARMLLKNLQQIQPPQDAAKEAAAAEGETIGEGGKDASTEEAAKRPQESDDGWTAGGIKRDPEGPSVSKDDPLHSELSRISITVVQISLLHATYQLIVTNCKATMTINEIDPSIKNSHKTNHRESIKPQNTNE
ncbi:HSP70 chaperone [Theileria orientalis strain Shintoku]|uniref:HSP70 chaperone n=1 Tax=Theileria orientalis strain Shintoku TaxID=869250 RepID=J4C2M6_THEOR|nr:HSP70 chaperone [Theileria orientalis strain Shintoku]BAM38956.1 HSP70 chaperone [Theileria orientalis strain Shintoku]|eukprot:XP_009689257.1 HSP70 chaperone [Theileria orientalis strain Shintoku]